MRFNFAILAYALRDTYVSSLLMGTTIWEDVSYDLFHLFVFHVSIIICCFSNKNNNYAAYC